MVIVQEQFLIKCNYACSLICNRLFFILTSFRGTGIINSLFTCLGGLLGIYFYFVLVHDHVSQEKLPASSLVLRRVCDLFPTPGVIFHTAFGLILLSIAIGLEFVVLWKSELNPGLLVKSTLNPSEATGHFSGLAVGPPSACGAGVGLLQLFSIFFLEKSLETSSAVTVIAAQVRRIKVIGRSLPSLNSFANGIKNYMALLFALGAIGGSAISSGLSKTIPLGSENGTNILSSILGGFILLLGARCAGGCTSGQGISGTNEQKLLFTNHIKISLTLLFFRYGPSSNRFLHHYSVYVRWRYCI